MQLIIISYGACNGCSWTKTVYQVRFQNLPYVYRRVLVFFRQMRLLPARPLPHPTNLETYLTLHACAHRGRSSCRQLPSANHRQPDACDIHKACERISEEGHAPSDEQALSWGSSRGNITRKARREFWGVCVTGRSLEREDSYREKK